jgi:hypothetical protein
MTGELLAYEARRVGMSVLGIPVAATVLTGLAIAAGAGLTGRLVPAAVESLPALAAGVAVAAVIGRDPARELQLSLPAGYGRTLANRLAPVLAGVVVGAVLATIAAVASGYWAAAPDPLTAQLVWLAPTSFLAGLAALVTMATAATGLGTAVVGVLWVIEAAKSSLFLGHPWQSLYLFANGVVQGAPFHDATGPTAAWWRDRLALCVAALLCTGLALVLARRPERLLRGAA